MKVEKLTMPMCRYGFRSGFATALVDGVPMRLHTSRIDKSCPDEHAREVREMFEQGKGEPQQQKGK